MPFFLSPKFQHPFPLPLGDCTPLLFSLSPLTKFQHPFLSFGGFHAPSPFPEPPPQISASLPPVLGDFLPLFLSTIPVPKFQYPSPALGVSCPFPFPHPLPKFPELCIVSALLILPGGGRVGASNATTRSPDPVLNQDRLRDNDLPFLPSPKENVIIPSPTRLYLQGRAQLEKRNTSTNWGSAI